MKLNFKKIIGFGILLGVLVLMMYPRQVKETAVVWNHESEYEFVQLFESHVVEGFGIELSVKEDLLSVSRQFGTEKTENFITTNSTELNDYKKAPEMVYSSEYYLAVLQKSSGLDTVMWLPKNPNEEVKVFKNRLATDTLNNRLAYLQKNTQKNNYSLVFVNLQSGDEISSVIITQEDVNHIKKANFEKDYFILETLHENIRVKV